MLLTQEIWVGARVLIKEHGELREIKEARQKDWSSYNRWLTKRSTLIGITSSKQRACQLMTNN